MQRNARCLRHGLLFLFVTLIVAGTGLAQPGQPELRVERSGDGMSTLVVEYDDATGRRVEEVLRQTSARVSGAQAGIDPEGHAAFSSWSEAGERWFSVKRGSGGWSKARATAMTIKMRDGDAVPGMSMPAALSGLAAQAGDSLFVVQFKTIGLPEWRAALESMGGEVFGYLPYNAHIVRMPAERADAARRLSFVERVEPFHPSYKLSQPIRDWLAETVESDEPKHLRVMALEWGLQGKQAVVDAARALGGEVVSFASGGYIVELNLNRAQLSQLVRSEHVQWVDPWTPAETDMDLVREDSGANWLENTLGWCGDGVRGEVLDQGIQEDHQDFDGIILHNNANVDSHGTSTYGIVFGNGDRDGDGNGQALGLMPCAQGIFGDFNDNVRNRRLEYTQELKESPYFASFQSNSWGDARTTIYNSLSSEMDDVIWRTDLAITQSQSNAGTQNSRPQAWAKNVIAVGGIDHNNTLDLADDSWSGGNASIGPAEDGRIKPDLHFFYDSVFTTTSGSGYTNFCCTSAATPQVAGVVGLLIQMWSENVWGSDPQGATVFDRTPHESMIRALAINNAFQYEFSGTGHDLTRVHQGWGRPNVQTAHERAATSFVTDQEQPLQVNDSISYDIEVPSGESELRVTMIYPDPPGTTSASMHRINDVDLKLTSPSGTVYHGNFGLDASHESSPNGTRDQLNTVENVFVRNPESGLWRVDVTAMEVNQDAHLDTPEDDVVFSLIATGATGQVCLGPNADFTIAPNPARVGDVVTFDSTVDGGAGGPYTFSWDFDEDGDEDSTLEDPTFVYNRPFVGMVDMQTRDSEDCPSQVQNSITVTGPDLRYDTHFNLTEVEGNGNGAIDPGETWNVSVDIRNDGNETAVGVEANLAVNPQTPGVITMLSDAAVFGDILVGFSGSSFPAFQFHVDSDFPCGSDAVFDLTNIRSIDPDNVYPDEIGLIRILVGGSGPPNVFETDSFEANNGWSFSGGGEWQITQPQGLGGGPALPGTTVTPDPDDAFDGSQVLGNDLTGLGPSAGNYESLISSYATSPPLDASGAIDVRMEYFRWLSVAPNDVASVEVSNDGVNWNTLYANTDLNDDGAWIFVSHDVSAWADGAADFRVRFGMQSDGVGTVAGWTLDLLRLSGVTRESCEPFAANPVPGATSSLTVEKLVGGDLDLRWIGDCGGTSTYGVYRGDLSVGYSSLDQEPGMCSVASTAATVPAGAGAADFFLVVPNDGSSEGSYGNDSDGISRDQASNPCQVQDTIDTCAP